MLIYCLEVKFRSLLQDFKFFLYEKENYRGTNGNRKVQAVEIGLGFIYISSYLFF